ncbi:MAG: hypothetical protein ACMUIL_03805 [bacterium]
MNREDPDILSLLDITPSALSIDYVTNKGRFQVHTLITEQRHPKTWNLSSAIKSDVQEGLAQILSIDEDIAARFHHLARDPAVLVQAARAVSTAVRQGKRIVVYGCGATGRLAKQMESALWRPFWKRIMRGELRGRLKGALFEDIEDRLIGVMTGGDRALISSLEGFEDLQLVGRLQIEERRVEQGDVVFCITEGGETSSVIGAMLAALARYGTHTPEGIEEARQHLYFLYNNPDDMLMPFTRSRSVIENPAFTKINLTTGPQAIAGSTRMQATTAETYIMGIILEETIRDILGGFLDENELTGLGFPATTGIAERLLFFDDIRRSVLSSLEDLGRLTLLESATYAGAKRATYCALQALITVFIDCTERSPTFRLHPLDTVRETERKCWVQVWTEGREYLQAWRNFLGRDFRGLDIPFYRSHFIRRIDDPWLKEVALRSLSHAGNDQKRLYDLSLSQGNIEKRGPQEGDLGVMVCMDEEIDALTDPSASFNRVVSLFKERNAGLALILIGDTAPSQVKRILSRLPLDQDHDVVIHIPMDRTGDPLNLNRHMALKILLNAHSTGVMARMGRVVGNTMTGVDPSNLKLIGRATHLIVSHVNDTVSQDEWIKRNGNTPPVTYAQANAVLFDAMDFVSRSGKQASEVALSIIRILEALRKKANVSWEEALAIAEAAGLERYLATHNPALRG